MKITKEMKSISDSLGLQALDALEIVDSFESVVNMLVGKFEYETINATKDRVVAHINKCPILSSSEMDSPLEVDSDMCPKYCASFVKTLNSDYTCKFTKKLCDNDHYCERIIELEGNWSSLII